MYGKNLKSSLYIRTSYENLSVKSSRTQDCWIQNIYPVRRSHDNDALIDSESVHLHKELVQCLLSFVMSASHTGSSASCNSVNLIDKNNTRCMFLGIFKQISYPGCSDSDKHFHEV